jgi:hypothetical protein
MRLDLPVVLLFLRVTARISTILLAGAFAASALRQLWPSPVTSWMAATRHRFTVLFALSHTFHLAGVVALVSLVPERFSTMSALPTFIFGGLGYALIYYAAVMAFARRKNPELRDSKMQTAVLYILWIVFTLAFVLGIRNNVWIYIPLATIMLLAWIARLYAKRVSAVVAPDGVTA